ncbi:MAG TPA: transposase [Phycisphaerae bacterium]|nr:transposase [Phycisphaerae bacterium]
MPRIARIVVPGCPHHITQRGNNRQDVFFVDDDRRTYLDLLHDRCEAAGVGVLGYCLMTNHVHVVAVPPDEVALAAAIGRAHFLYSQYINRLHGRSGHLWQGRFYSAALDEPHTWAALRYVECNPLRARLVRKPWRYAWSSAAAHVGEGPDASGLLDLAAWAADWTPARWRAQLAKPLTDAEIARLRRCVHTGRPLATDKWLSKLERKLGQRLRPRPVGRPKAKKGVRK